MAVECATCGGIHPASMGCPKTPVETPAPKVTASKPMSPLVYVTVFSQVTILPFNCDQCGLCWLDTDHSWGSPLYKTHYPPCPRCSSKRDLPADLANVLEEIRDRLKNRQDRTATLDAHEQEAMADHLDKILRGEWHA